MEKRKDSLSIVKMCRFCLVQNDTLESLYDRNRSANNAVNLHLKILTCVSIEIFPSDKMPTFICKRCKFYMNLFYEYKQIVRHSDETILQYIQHNTPMEIITWPSFLANVFRKGNESFDILETVEGGGAPLQVSSQDNFDSDEEDGNVYNIKIGDGPHDVSKTACVKVFTSKDGKEMKQIIQDPNIKGTEVGEVLEKTGECWACDECECTYPLQQLLELHKIQKHRARTVECDLCNAKFFTKYDLSAHQARHSDEMPFQCAACAKKFKRLIMLKRHEKMVHSDLPQQVCANCPASFLTIEELEEHKKKHIRVHRPYICNLCDKKFHEKNTLQRHIVAVHNKEATYCCEYCPERFSTVTKLTRHVRSHAGLRPYPCKYCDKSFTKSHHYTRHVRQKHRGGAISESEQYRCEQCADSFATQDELIYHSAIHATQNLTCPLCQEKFPDVDAVTAHIKSHVNGAEFICDYCELVFTAKDKLENHQIKVHEEEINADEMCDYSSMENEEEHDDDDDSINVKEEDDHMVIEIKKPNEFMIDDITEEQEERAEYKPEVINSEESGSEATYLDLGKMATAPVVNQSMAGLKKNPIQILENKPVVIKPGLVQKVRPKPESKPNDKPVIILHEEMKRKVIEQAPDIAVIDKKKVVEEKPAVKVEGTNSGGASDKSLRLLEKELQDLKRTNSLTEGVKTPIKTSEANRSKRQPMHTSTPKSKVIEDKKLPPNKSPAVEKKSEKRITKENKEPKEVKETKSSNGNNKEEKDKKDEKEKETTSKQSFIKNGTSNDNSNSEDGTVRRSTRPSKIQNYAKMIRDRSQAKAEDEDDEDDESSSEDDEEYIDDEKSIEARFKSRRASQGKPLSAAKPTPVTPASTPRKRGRPRKVPLAEVPAKIKKQDNDEVKEEIPEDTSQESDVKEEKMETDAADETEATSKTGSEEQKDPPKKLMKSPSGQTLKKVPIKALPPGIKPMPLPLTSRSITGEVCEMQIGKKVVKVQKIVMTKAEVEEMAKKGLVEMKDGTMVLKQGIKLPTVDTPMKTNLGNEETEKESPVTKQKAAPTRCDLGDDS